jgi:hypothetical protein
LPSPPLFPVLNPSICPTIPPGFGTGHSLRDLLLAESSFITSSVSLETSSTCFAGTLPSGVVSVVSTTFRRLLRFCVPSGFISPSAYATRGAGQGSACGRPTTKKLARRVVAKREDVHRERGCRWGGMMCLEPTKLNPANNDRLVECQ